MRESQRWIVQRTFAWLGNFHRLLVRHESFLYRKDERLLGVYHGFMLICLSRISGSSD